MEKMVVKNFVISTKELRLFLDDGREVSINQGDPRIESLVVNLHKQITEKGQAEITLGSENHLDNLARFEKKTGGLVRFFKVGLDKIKKFFGEDSFQELVIPSDLATVIENIEREADRISSSKDINTTAGEVAVALVTKEDGSVGVIPNTEPLDKYINHSLSVDNTIGVQKLMQRMAAMSETRLHSVEDLLKFLKEAELTISDTGDIIALKVLKKVGDKWADCHTKKVFQGVGSIVRVPASLVDPDRTADCSHGLHIAATSYLSYFSGDICTVVIVKPEDVIAVPQYSHNKMRVCEYFIAGVITKEEYWKVQFSPDNDYLDESKKLFNNLVSGNYPDPKEIVTINGHLGSDISVVSLISTDPVISTNPVREVDPIIRKKGDKTAPIVKPSSVAQSLTQREKIRELFTNYELDDYSDEALKELVDFKRKTKRGWKYLGLDEVEIAYITNHLNRLEEK